MSIITNCPAPTINEHELVAEIKKKVLVLLENKPEILIEPELLDKIPRKNQLPIWQSSNILSKKSKTELIDFFEDSEFYIQYYINSMELIQQTAEYQAWLVDNPEPDDDSWDDWRNDEVDTWYPMYCTNYKIVDEMLIEILGKETVEEISIEEANKWLLKNRYHSHVENDEVAKHEI